MKLRQYITETKVFSAASQTDTNANSVIFVNQGESTVIIDGFVLTPNQSWNITGNENEINIKVYSFNFQGAGKNQLTVILKRYI